MKTPRNVLSSMSNRAVLLTVLFAAASLFARDETNTVVFSPQGGVVEGNLPYVKSVDTEITAPSTLPAGANLQVTLNVDPTFYAVGDATTAKSYVSIQALDVAGTPMVNGSGQPIRYLNFTAPGQKLKVRIIASLPLLNVAPGSLAFSYQLTTTGWGNNASGQPITPVDSGFSLNARVTVAAPDGAPPTVQITTPVTPNNIFNRLLTDPLGPVTLNFNAVASDAYPILTVDAYIAPILIASPEVLGPELQLTVSKSGIGTALALGTSAMPVPAVGSYRVKVRATNGKGEAWDQTTFTVTLPILEPPVVSISTPTDGQHFSVPAASLPSNMVDLLFVATSSGLNKSVIDNVTASLDGAAVTLSSVTGLNQYDTDGVARVTGRARVAVTSVGSHSFTVTAHNAGGDAIPDTNTFWIDVTANPPTVVITSPVAPNNTFTYMLGDAPKQIPFTFTATSNFGGIRTLSAKVNNGTATSYPAAELGHLTETRTISLTRSYTEPGTYAESLSAATSDDYGSDDDVGSFTVTVPDPNPAIVYAPHYLPSAPSTLINLSGATFSVSSSGNITLPYRFNSTSNNGYVVETVSVSLDGVPIAAPATASSTGLNTPSAVTTGTVLVGPGSHTISATMATGKGTMTRTASVSFTVKNQVSTPPTVEITTPPLGSSYTRVSGGPALSIPLTFVGRSTMGDGKISKLTASLDGTPLTVTPSNLNTGVANGAATMSVTTAGTHTIAVSATDQYGTASTTRTFTVCVVQGKSICGRIFFDVNYNGVFDTGSTCGDEWDRYCRDRNEWDDCRGSRYDSYYDRGNCWDRDDRTYCRDSGDTSGEDFGLNGITVKLLNSSRQVVATAVSGADGSYCFNNIAPGNYYVSAVSPTGYDATTQAERAVCVGSKNICVRDIGFGLEFEEIRNYCAKGYSSSFWKTQIEKACNGDRRNVDIDANTCNVRTRTVANLCLSVFDSITLKSACSTLGTKSTSSKDLLMKELCAAEYNYAHGSYINNDRTLTYCFIQWGERVAKSSSYSDSYRKYAKGWMQAFNECNGGKVAGPR